MSQLEDNKAKRFSFYASVKVSLFILFRPSTGWMGPIHFRENNLLLFSLPVQMLILSRNTLMTTLKTDNMCPNVWTRHDSVKLT